jgi:hypothetical protein
MSKHRGELDFIIGLTVVGGCTTGVVSFIGAIFAFFSGEPAAAGVCLIGAALSFGLLANAVLRK